MLGVPMDSYVAQKRPGTIATLLRGGKLDYKAEGDQIRFE